MPLIQFANKAIKKANRLTEGKRLTDFWTSLAGSCFDNREAALLAALLVVRFGIER